MNVPLIFVFACLAISSRGSVLPAYIIYEDVLAHIEKMPKYEMIDLLTEMVDNKERKERAKRLKYEMLSQFSSENSLNVFSI